tara:strand:- start:4718 stop:5029 length:312 start_codon:yes stop_codon:yes gene_type:complete
MTAWTDHCKEYAQKHGITYKQAMTEAKGSYTKTTTAKSAPKDTTTSASEKPAKKDKKEKTEMPDKVKKAEKHDALKNDYEKGERVESAKKVSKSKKAPMPLMI